MPKLFIVTAGFILWPISLIFAMADLPGATSQEMDAKLGKPACQGYVDSLFPAEVRQELRRSGNSYSGVTYRCYDTPAYGRIYGIFKFNHLERVQTAAEFQHIIQFVWQQTANINAQAAQSYFNFASRSLSASMPRSPTASYQPPMYSTIQTSQPIRRSPMQRYAVYDSNFNRTDALVDNKNRRVVIT